MASIMQSRDEMAADLSVALNGFFSERNTDPKVALEAMALSTASLVTYFRKEMGVDLTDSQVELIRKRVGEMAPLQ